MSRQELLTVLELGVREGRISPPLAAYIAAEVLGVEARATDYDAKVRLDDPAVS
jgi:hypothetical protein